MTKNNIYKSLMPHLIAVGIFTVLTWAYMLPVLQGSKLAQHDVVQALGMQQEIREHYDKTGEWSLWTGSMFGGMPVYQIYMHYPSNLLTQIILFIKYLFPDNTELVFLMFLGVYILTFVVTKNPWVAILSAIAFTFSSINFINIDAGHGSKVRAIALMAPILAGFFAAFNGRYLVGFAIAVVALALQIRSNHFQITYYTFIAAGLISLFYLILALREKKIAEFLKSLVPISLAVILGICSNVSQLWTTYEYAKDTIRGGTSELSQNRTSGLDKDYAFSWSYGKLETFTLLIPNFMGGASQESLGENSNLAVELSKKGVPKNQINKIVSGVPTYWGNQPFTSGPTYFGAITCFLFVFGMFLIKNPVKWVMLIIGVLCMFLSWGKNLEWFNILFFEYFPMYNKFRTPAMILSVTNLMFVFIAGLGIYELISKKFSNEHLINSLKYSLGLTAGITLLMGIGGSMFFDFKAEVDQQLAQGGWPIDAIRADRADMMRTDALRSLAFILASGVLIWAFIQSKIKSTYFLLGMTTLMLLDLWPVCKRYLNDDDFVTKSEWNNIFKPGKANLEIARDGDLSYRVLNLTTSTFNDAMTSYHHKSVGGYHAAKLRRYQDLIERQIGPNMSKLNQGFSNDNIPVLNMLNMRYIIAKDDQVIRNPSAMGNAWFVSDYQIVEGAEAEMNALTNFNPTNTAIVEKRFEKYLTGFKMQEGESTGTITMTSYSPDKLSYNSNTEKEQLAVFSEVYYNSEKGWKAYLDGKETEHFRVNYVLRAMRIPAGEHLVEFKFEPKSYYTGERISLAFSSFTLLLVLGILIMKFKKHHLSKNE